MLTPDDNNALFQIRGFKSGAIQINDQIYNSSIIISAKNLITDWQPQSVTELSAKDLEIILTLKPTILLIGTGDTQQFIPVEIYGELINHGIGVEVMNTPAACRTYMALTSENRNVVAALLL